MHIIFLVPSIFAFSPQKVCSASHLLKSSQILSRKIHISWLVFLRVFSSTYSQSLAFGITPSPPQALSPVCHKIILNSNPVHQPACRPSQLGVICKFNKFNIHFIIQIINANVERVLDRTYSVYPSRLTMSSYFSNLLGTHMKVVSSKRGCLLEYFTIKKKKQKTTLKFQDKG